MSSNEIESNGGEEPEVEASDGGNGIDTGSLSDVIEIISAILNGTGIDKLIPRRNQTVSGKW